METLGGSQPLEIKVLYTAGCPGTPRTIQLIEEVVEGMGMSVRLEQILVESPEQAMEQRFLGSPTVQVNGLDVDPSARQNTAYGFT
jgi:hypothetical protein